MGLNHDKIQYLKLSYLENITFQVYMTGKYRMRPESFQTLMLIWLTPCISAFRISAKQIGIQAAVQQRLRLLLSKGLIEKTGSGKHMCALYSVSPLFFSELESISL